MKMKSLLISLLAISGTVYAEEMPLVPMENQSLVIQNRVLTQVNGKTISVMDLVKRMDLFLQKHYPEIADAPGARYQFFSTQWRFYLDQLIDTELMLLDAEKLEVKVPDAEVREEILSRFGPNVMPALDKAGLTYEEAKKVVHDEMIVQRIQWFRVNSKVMTQVNSQDVKAAYKRYIEKNPETDLWDYQVLSVRSADENSFSSLATTSCQSLEDVASLLKAKDEKLTLSISSDIHTENKALSAAHREVLSKLKPGEFSSPIAQISRGDQSTVYRIFHLKEHTVKPVPSFASLADSLKGELLQDLANKESERYLVRLKKQLGYEDQQLQETLPQDFQPFSLAYR